MNNYAIRNTARAFLQASLMIFHPQARLHIWTHYKMWEAGFTAAFVTSSSLKLIIEINNTENKEQLKHLQGAGNVRTNSTISVDKGGAGVNMGDEKVGKKKLEENKKAVCFKNKRTFLVCLLSVFMNC